MAIHIILFFNSPSWTFLQNADPYCICLGITGKVRVQERLLFQAQLLLFTADSAINVIRESVCLIAGWLVIGILLPGNM